MYDLLIFVDNRHEYIFFYVRKHLKQLSTNSASFTYMMFSDIHFFNTVIPSTQVTFRPPSQKGCHHEITCYLGMERYLRMKRHFSKECQFRMKRSQRIGRRHLSTERQPGMESHYGTKCHLSMERHRRKEL